MNTGHEYLLSVQQVSHAYTVEPVLRAVDLQIAAGEIVCLLGPSGCGKTTLLRCIAGLEGLRGGAIFIAGAEVSTARRTVPPERRGVGMVFQDFALFPHKNISDNVAFGLRGFRHEQRQQRVRETLKRVQAEELAQAWPHQLSGGQQQRIALARALAPQPRLMLMDEPFSGLDATLRRSLRHDARLLLKEVGIATLLVTHDGEEALQMADRVVLMNQGRIVLDGPPETVWRNPVDAFSASFFGDCTTIRATVRDGAVRVGPLSIPGPEGAEDGAPMDVVLRHTGLRLRPASPQDSDESRVPVIDERFLGGRRQTDIAIEHHGQRLALTARHDNDQHYTVGQSVVPSLVPGGVFCFPGDESAA
ncbi:MAG: ABC transporter ATP-binding protein [Planctomycetota bacterium]|nr:MAG: ABC transporter ATP-binding protein [Planctomycetota bacterium]